MRWSYIFCYSTYPALLRLLRIHKATKGGGPLIETESLAEGAVGPTVEPDGLQAGLEDALDLLGGSTQWVVAGSVGAALVTRADSETLVWVVGSLFNAVFSKVLKRAINQVTK